jgi:vancomycin permeability regulator SanA
LTVIELGLAPGRSQGLGRGGGRRRRASPWPWIARGLALFAVLFVISAIAIVWDGLTDAIAPSDVGVVLGSKVEPGGPPSSRLKARLDEALVLYRRGLFRTVIVSGAAGKEGYDEAAVMKAYLVAQGVPDAAIVADNAGVNTRATGVNTAAYLRAHGLTSAMAVTQYFHISRTRLAFKQAGIKTVNTAHAHHFDWRDLYSIPREVAGYAAYLAR